MNNRKIAIVCPSRAWAGHRHRATVLDGECACGTIADDQVGIRWVQIGNGGTTGSITGNVADNGTLAFDRSDSVSFSGTYSGFRHAKR